MSTFDEASKGAKMDFAKDKSYGDYLGLDQILTTENPLDMAHDGLLFIIQHQTSELWMKLAIHELTACRKALQAGDLRPSFKMLTRVARIFEQLNSAWDVLRTMTPSEYTQFRPYLGASSGFQSYQYRLIEYLLGNRIAALTKLHEHTPEPHAALVAEMEQPSLYQVAVDLLCDRMGCPRLPASPSRAHGRPSERCKTSGKRFMKTRQPIGNSTNWRRSSLILRIISAAGGSTTSPPWNASSDSNAVRAAPRV